MECVFPRNLRQRAGCLFTGFSLVEVTLAMGIIAFSVLVVMALMPVGLASMRSAIDQTTEAQIVRKVSGEIFLTPFKSLVNAYNGREFYYDDEGTAESAQSAMSRYLVRTRVAAAEYPGSRDAALTNALTNSLVAVRIEVVVPAAGGGTSRSTNVYHVRVPNSGN